MKPAPHQPAAPANTLSLRVFERLFDRLPVGMCLLSRCEDPVILIANEAFLQATGRYGQQAERRHALKAGFNEHLVKPADPLQLLTLLERAPDGP